jgi:hypothetical protein
MDPFGTGSVLQHKDVSFWKRLSPRLTERQRNFRWIITYPAEELTEILREKSGFDFGTLEDQPPSSWSFRTDLASQIGGSKMSMVVGKELEIRRWLSRSHLYSSAHRERET